MGLSSRRWLKQDSLTVQTLGITGALYRTLRTTNPIENLNGSIAHFTRNVKRWKDGQVTQRWIAGMLSDAKGGASESSVDIANRGSDGSIESQLDQRQPVPNVAPHSISNQDASIGLVQQASGYRPW